MKTYHIIDSRNRDTKSELKRYTFEQLKDYFKPDECEDDFEEWKGVEDLYDLYEFLKNQAEGMDQPYEFEEDEVEDIESMERANSFYKTAR